MVVFHLSPDMNSRSAFVKLCRGAVDLIPCFFAVFGEFWLQIGDITFMDCPEELKQGCQTSLRRNFVPYGIGIVTFENL